MTTRRLRDSLRDRALALPTSDVEPVPPALRGRPPALRAVLLGWLGGGAIATAVALVTDSPNDLQYGLVNTGVACAALLLAAVPPRGAGARRTAPPTVLTGEPVPVPVPVQATADDRRSPALR